MVTQMEAARTLRRARHSERLRRFLRQHNQHGAETASTTTTTTTTGAEDSNSREALMPVVDVEREQQGGPMSTATGTTVAVNPRERIKQQLIRSIDTLLR